jgi:hypothetical protein
MQPDSYLSNTHFSIIVLIWAHGTGCLLLAFLFTKLWTYVFFFTCKTKLFYKVAGVVDGIDGAFLEIDVDANGRFTLVLLTFYLL